jgi:hypothetical protein
VVMSPAEIGPENVCSGKDQQQLQTTDPRSCQRCYMRTITEIVQLENKNSGRGSQGACRQDELIGDKPPVVKQL